MLNVIAAVAMDEKNQSEKYYGIPDEILDGIFEKTQIENETEQTSSTSDKTEQGKTTKTVANSPSRSDQKDSNEEQQMKRAKDTHSRNEEPTIEERGNLSRNLTVDKKTLNF